MGWTLRVGSRVRELVVAVSCETRPVARVSAAAARCAEGSNAHERFSDFSGLSPKLARQGMGGRHDKCNQSRTIAELQQ